VETIRDILASHESGISRDGLLAWARLRGDPQMTDQQLDAALAELGDQVVDVQGFLYLRQNAPESALRDEASRGTPTPTPPPAWPPAVTGAEGAAPPSAWPPADAGAAPPAPPPGSWTPPDGQAWGTPPPAPGAEGWTAPDGGLAPAPSSGGKRTMSIATIGVAIFLALAAFGAVLLRSGADETPPADATPALPTPTSGSVIGAFTIELGDCLILPSADQFEEVRRLECTEPHDGEVFFVEEHPGSEFPSDDDFSTYVEEQCLPSFADYTGSAYDDQDVLDVGWFTPTQGSWDNGDREVVCYLTPVDGSRTSQSYRGANP
jgi:hypothetical protein